MPTETTRLELVSFDLCPFVQRSVITLKHKKIDFKITFIDLNQPPEWFTKLSPMGKVPILLVGEHTETSEPTVLFESAVINEYLDEITPPSLIAKDPLQKARERAWIEVASELAGTLYHLQHAEDVRQTKQFVADFWELIGHVEAALPGGNYFRRTGFSLVDTAFAPVFMRAKLLAQTQDPKGWKKFPKVEEWAHSLLALKEVQESVVPNFAEKYLNS